MHWKFKSQKVGNFWCAIFQLTLVWKVLQLLFFFKAFMHKMGVTFRKGGKSENIKVTMLRSFIFESKFTKCQKSDQIFLYIYNPSEWW